MRFVLHFLAIAALAAGVAAAQQPHDHGAKAQTPAKDATKTGGKAPAQAEPAKSADPHAGHGATPAQPAPAQADPHAGHGAAPAAGTPPPAADPHAGHGEPAAAVATPGAPDPRPAFFRGKSFSEFNHRVAGLFVLLAGLFYLISDRVAQRWPGARYAWPVCLLVPGLYLILFSDPKWPFGPRGFFELLQTNQEFLQHKTYSVILITLGMFELARVRGAIRGAWAALVFPVIAVAGATMLLFHPHGQGVHSPEHMAAMSKIETQHLWFTIVGCAIAVTKGLSELAWSPRAVFLRVWPSLMIILGVMLLLYAE